MPVLRATDRTHADVGSAGGSADGESAGWSADGESVDGEPDPTIIGPSAFASTAQLSRAQMLAARVRWPRPSRLQEPLRIWRPKMAAGLRSLGLTSVGSLLEHLPRTSRDASTIDGLRPGEAATVAVEVCAIAARPVRRRGMKPLVAASVFDETGTMQATFFNQPWLAQRYTPGTRLLLHGRITERGTFNVVHHAVTGRAGGAGAGEARAGGVRAGAGTGGASAGGAGAGGAGASGARASGVRAGAGTDGASAGGARAGGAGAGGAGAGGAGVEVVAHYPAAEGISSTQILTLVQGASPALKDIPEVLDAQARVSERLPSRASALAAMHGARTPAEREAGRERLAFEELLLAQLVFLRRRARRRTQGGAARLAGPPSLSLRWLEYELPFALTADQRRAIEVIGQDLACERAMQRLLLGEVGSGKTVVAVWAMLRAVEHDAQAALMAPTETLAEQHHATLQQLLGAEQANVRCALLTGSTPARRRADTLGRLATGELQLIVGTHALIEPDVHFRSLAVAVVDEQHRFGVRQRAALDGKAAPHVLHMTATPIPRTLALAGYGDLDTTMLRQRPAGRQPIDTRIVSGEPARTHAYEQLRAELRAGRQAYVVCPLIEPDGAEADGVSDLRAATAELQRLQSGELADHRLVLLHGGMRPAQKAQAMAEFAAGAADVLVATTVIEVGIDVPNATTIVVENAERFGISQLHQLRGRVGRGTHRSTCLLMGSPRTARLRALAEHDDGFVLAEIDLRLRNEGELIGTRQSGIGQHRIASLPEDSGLLERARARADAIIAADPDLRQPEHVLLGDALERVYGASSYEPIPG